MASSASVVATAMLFTPRCSETLRYAFNNCIAMGAVISSLAVYMGDPFLKGPK